MPAYLAMLHVPTCEWDNCPRSATQELRDSLNQRIGRFCTEHGLTQLLEFRKKYELPR